MGIWSQSWSRKTLSLYTGTVRNLHLRNCFLGAQCHLYLAPCAIKNYMFIMISSVWILCDMFRVNELEEQLKDQETRSEQNLQAELRRHRETFNKMERDKNTQIELLTNKWEKQIISYLSALLHVTVIVFIGSISSDCVTGFSFFTSKGCEDAESKKCMQIRAQRSLHGLASVLWSFSICWRLLKQLSSWQRKATQNSWITES